MTPAEAQVLLSMASAFDNRKPDPDAAKAWAAALDGLRFEDCRDVLIEHFQTSTEWLMPATVRIGVKRIRSKRIALAGDLIPPPGLSELDSRQWLRQAKRRIGDGEPVEVVAPKPAIAPNPQRLRELIAAATPKEADHA